MKKNQRNKDGNQHGYWSNGKLSYKGNYLNGERDGYWEDYYSNGRLYNKGNYIKKEFHI